jgi:DNA repair photolyase
MHDDPPPPPARIRGRGAGINPVNRFEEIGVVLEPETEAELRAGVPTRFYRDRGRSVIATNTSPDVGFDASLNPYRGCEHGCIYCYARPTHEYFGLSAGLDFETRIMVKEDAPALLRKALSSPRWEPKVLALSGVTDPYQPVEKRLGLTRRCLEVLAEFRNPVAVITKNHLVTRDLDLLEEMARHRAASVSISITTLDDMLRNVMEPRTSSPRRRLDAVRALSEAGIPVGVNVAPVIPGLTEPEIPAVVSAAAEAGAAGVSYTVLRLPHAVAPLFERWLEAHLPGRRDKVLNRIRAMRGGRLNDPRFGSRMRGEGIYAREIRTMFELARKRAGLGSFRGKLSTEAFRRPPGPQLALF